MTMCQVRDAFLPHIITYIYIYSIFHVTLFFFSFTKCTKAESKEKHCVRDPVPELTI